MGNYAEGMHPNFRNFYKLGGDPLMDMGPYYLTAMIAMLGPVRRVTGSAQQLYEEIAVKNPRSLSFGETVRVGAPTNVTATLDFHNGVVASLQAAKEGFGYKPRLEIYGTEGNLSVPDPNLFGPVPASSGFNFRAPRRSRCRLPTALRKTAAESALRIWPMRSGRDCEKIKGKCR